MVAGTLVILLLCPGWHNVHKGRTQEYVLLGALFLRSTTSLLRMGSRCGPLYLASAAFCLWAVLSLSSSASGQAKTVRRLVYKENPGYPLTLREAHIGGIVRLEIVISPKGNVDSISPLGGNPVLVEASSAAVRKWKYAPSDSETKTQVEFTFDPKH